MKQCTLAIFLHFALLSSAQTEKLFDINADGMGFHLTLKGASHLASLPLKCIDKEFPNKTNHTSVNDSDHVLLPSVLHPAFYGCFDWHSSVHGHWMLMRLLKNFPQLPEAAAIRKALDHSLTIENIKGELRYFDIPMTSSWERTYGWAWILKIDEELSDWNDADARKWKQALQPLTQKIVSLWKAFLPKQTYPNRTGVHPNTAFGLVFALQYARAAGDKDLESAILRSSRSLFLTDKNSPASWEPNGSDFLSPTLEEADLMRMVLSPKEFKPWFDQFVSLPSLKHLSVLPVVSDRTDLQIVHLDGLCFSRAWCMNNLAKMLPANDPRKKLLMKSAYDHLASALPHVVSGEYGGEHWLASFAVLALTD
ncbi:MAG: DUF2891 domain-containing protein [Chitinophagaceae bacterium]|nr:DUF2891 domain-containing protein [Chitinophagaceae bacterium]